MNDNLSVEELKALSNSLLRLAGEFRDEGRVGDESATLVAANRVAGRAVELSLSINKGEK